MNRRVSVYSRVVTIDDLRRAAELLPEGSSLTLPREALLEAMAPVVDAITTGSPTWRERLWTCPDDTRLRVPDLAEALGRPRSWVYRASATSRGMHRLPVSRLSGELVFEAGAVRAWVERESEHGT